MVADLDSPAYYSRKAEDWIAEEIGRTSTEIEELACFRAKVQNIDPDLPNASSPSAPVDISADNGMEGNGKIREVREAYRDTFMSMGHYKEEYDQSLPESLAEEFDSPEIGMILAGGERFTPNLKEALVSRTNAAVERRKGHLSMAKKERSWLNEAISELKGIDEDVTSEYGWLEDVSPIEARENGVLLDMEFDELVEVRELISEVMESCEELISRRKEYIQNLRSRYTFHENADLWEYFNQDFAVTHPVLEDATTLKQEFGDYMAGTETAIANYYG